MDGYTQNNPKKRGLMSDRWLVSHENYPCDVASWQLALNKIFDATTVLFRKCKKATLTCTGREGNCGRHEITKLPLQSSTLLVKTRSRNAKSSHYTMHLQLMRLRTCSLSVLSKPQTFLTLDYFFFVWKHRQKETSGSGLHFFGTPDVFLKVLF